METQGTMIKGVDGPPTHVCLVDSTGQLLLQRGLGGDNPWTTAVTTTETDAFSPYEVLKELEADLGWRPKHFEVFRSGSLSERTELFVGHLDLPISELKVRPGCILMLVNPSEIARLVDRSELAAITTFLSSDAYKRLKRTYDNIFSLGLLINAAGELLLQKREDKEHVVNPGLWGTFGGTIEPYETPDDGFLREMAEELGWRPARFGLYRSFQYRGAGLLQLAYAYYAPIATGTRLTLGEGEEMAFFRPDALPTAVVPDLRVLVNEFSSSPYYEKTIQEARDR